MPCPFFEPQGPAQPATHRFGFGRLPLIEEYDGICHLRGQHPVTDAAVRLAGCNCGNADNLCSEWNQHLQSAAQRHPIMRFSVLSRQTELLHLAVIEELEYAPVRWQNITFRSLSQSLDPNIEEPCRRAQVLAFCQSYLRRFPLTLPE